MLGDASGHAADLSARFKARAVRAWGRFKLAAVSSFAFVEASGPAYIVKLARDALGVGELDWRPIRHPVSIRHSTLRRV